MNGKTALFWLISMALFVMVATPGCTENEEAKETEPIEIKTPTERGAQERLPEIKLGGNLLQTAPKAVTVDDLENLPPTEYAVLDPYLKKRVVYRGVLLKNLVAKYARPGTKRIRLRAIDEYKAEFIKEEWVRFDIMLATRMNGNRMGIRENGPARIVLPYDTAKGINKTLYKPRWIWQVNRIEFLEE